MSTRRLTRSTTHLISSLAVEGGASSSSEYSYSYRGGLDGTSDTPGTSTIPTPAAEMSSKALGKKPATRNRVDAAQRARELRESKYALNPKRKRGDDSESEPSEEDSDGDGMTDDVLNSASHRLGKHREQEKRQRADRRAANKKKQANAPGSSRAASTKKKTRREAVADSDAFDTDDEELPSETDWKVPGPSTRPARLPSAREAKSSAKKAIVATFSPSVKPAVRRGKARMLPPTVPGTSDSDFQEDSERDATSESTDAEVKVEPVDEEDTSRGPVDPVNPSTPSSNLTVPARFIALRQARAALARGGRRPRPRRAASPNQLPDLNGSDSEEFAALMMDLPDAARRYERIRRKLKKHHPEVRNLWETLTAMPVIPKVRAPQPASISRSLKSFQLEGLHWMIEQEKTQWKGGLLGDEMGMGKTIQAVSLIMSDHPTQNPSLVVVPPVAMMQWRKEINEYTNGSLKVLLYHGVAVKKMSLADIKSHNVIITSYSTLESAYRKQIQGIKRKSSDEEPPKKKQKKAPPKGGPSPFHAIHFHRVILDEAHSIKTRSSSTAKACIELQTDFRWCLSGTPLQNRIGELFSLLRFLRVRPFASYMCVKCDCNHLHWDIDSASAACRTCKHRGFDHVSLFNVELLKPIVEFAGEPRGEEAFRKLHSLLDRIMLRRVKSDYMADMELPPKYVGVHSQFFGTVERDFASSIMSNTTRQFDTYVAQGVMLNNYANIFGLIMQMRQVADHPDMILRKKGEGGQNVLVCCICDDPAEEAIRSVCRHDFCRACAKTYVRSFSERGEDPGCPSCHIPLSIDLEQEAREQDELALKKTSIINRIQMEKWTSSTKIEMLLMELLQLRSSKRTTKSIIFSQFTSMLQLVEWRLRRAGFNTVMLDGSMTPAQRQSSIDYFMKNYDVEVFLVSLKAGGVALNLTEASQVYIVDPWWNPAAEWQSADRCHRIGQTRPCRITRLVIEDSVESRMVLLQEKKTNMIHGTINADESAMQNLSAADMEFLFRGT
ncbi:MAG: DNA repair protein rad16 [Watsoniomyces obsoletus]|nr:MAG: DNA repair protein rad16 [Watsoniomyces obsoletus]